MNRRLALAAIPVALLAQCTPDGCAPTPEPRLESWCDGALWSVRNPGTEEAVTNIGVLRWGEQVGVPDGVDVVVATWQSTSHLYPRLDCTRPTP